MRLDVIYEIEKDRVSSRAHDKTISAREKSRVTVHPQGCHEIHARFTSQEYHPIKPGQMLQVHVEVNTSSEI
jgi:hypothetical protein